jgi:hypothetical protein
MALQRGAVSLMATWFEDFVYFRIRQLNPLTTVNDLLTQFLNKFGVGA